MSIREFALTQDEAGMLDLTVGRQYVVYGIRENKYGKFYLILTDSLNTELPWWMPASVLKIIDPRQPDSWKEYSWEGNGKETIQANPIYFDAQQDVEDGTPRGREVFAVMQRDTEN